MKPVKFERGACFGKGFYIFRHGETDEPSAEMVGSGTDYDLTEDGVSQAEELSAKLAGKGLKLFIPVLCPSPTYGGDRRPDAEGAGEKRRLICGNVFYGEAEGRPIAELQKEMPEIVNNWSNT